jgi:hypothetical protein
MSVIGRSQLPRLPAQKQEPARTERPQVRDAWQAEARVRSHIGLPEGATVTATTYAGGPAILISVPGKPTEAFVDRTYTGAVEEAEHWLETREERVPVRQGNRQERRRAEQIVKKRRRPN